ncbi:MAG TPA: phenylalanine--tRNA ligase subunit alpha [Candidatus Acidoferrales bacterium]|jgi:phenylalanyl-tRNA synthetase alpha chain|nr:phenylalanine--tRNA ligase subunit alpha [Candidatus Acidoferrales bacterium]
MSGLTEQLTALAARLDDALKATAEAKGLEELRIAYLGRSGEVTAIRRQIGMLPAAERPAAGKTINDAVEAMEAQFERAETALRSKALEASLQDAIDVTFPGPPPAHGSIHPIRRTMEDACRYFQRRGFAVVLGNEIETDYHNFDALNIPPDHPAREGLDSFYVRPDLVLRTHTSPMQIRTMQAYPPPVAIVVPGKVYRRDAVDARHSYMFHQIEGLMVGEGIHFGHLKGMLQGMCRELFGPRQAVRFRPSFFPFTEPSAEVDTTCPACGGSGGSCRTCGGAGWIEIGGAGMVHPDVLREVKYDPSRVSGWAFGMGIERIAMVRHDMHDIRAFYENEPGFLEQLG